MRAARLLCVLLLPVGLAACGRNAPATADAARDAAPISADLGTQAAAPQSAPPIRGLGDALGAAEGCVIEGRPRRGCLGYDRLRAAVIAHQGEKPWQDEVLALAGGPAEAAHTRLALTLLADGALAGPADRLVAVMLPLCDVPVPFVRAQALRSLANFDGVGVVEKALTAVENDADAEVRESAAYLLGRPEQARAGKPAVTALLRALANDADPSVKRAAIGALGRFRPPEALPTLVALMDDPLLGPNATLEVGTYTQSAAYQAILSRIAEAKNGRAIPPATLAALTRMRAHPDFNADQVRQLLEAVLPFAQKDEGPTGRIVVQQITQQLEQLAAAPAAPPSAPGSEK